MPEFLKESQRVALRRPQLEDQDEFLALTNQSKDFFPPWVFPPITLNAYQRYLATLAQSRNDGFLLCHGTTRAIMGVINVNEIVRGFFLSAYLGYYIGKQYADKGYMKEGLSLVVSYAFTELQLHRLEANIQPENHSSIALVKSCGFKKEGFSPRYLKIDGQWRDHERWAILNRKE